MRLLKSQNTNRRSIAGKGIKYDINDQIVMDSKKSLLLPKGTTEERPTNFVNGSIRYNTTTNEMEVYQDNSWRKIRYKEPSTSPGIVQQNLGSGDSIEVDFGPLVNNDSEYPIPIAAQNILVFVENVFQISTTNYTLVQNPAGKPVGWYVRFGTPVPTGKPVTVLHNFDK